MSTPPKRTPNRQDPLGLVKAILAGLGLGFFAVLLIPYILPSQETGQSLAQTPGYEKPFQIETGEIPATPVKAAASVRADTKTQERKQVSPDPQARKTRNRQQTAGREPPEDGEAKPETESGQPAPPETGKKAKPDPILIPAAGITFPKPFSSEEMTAALQPLLSFRISEDDGKAVKEAIEAASRGDDGGARAAINKISAPAAKAFAGWKRAGQLAAGLEEAFAFRLAHPLFPEPPQTPATEKSLFLSNAPSGSVLKFYTNRMPSTGAGHASLGAALMETGERERGLTLIRLAWQHYALDPTAEQHFLSRFGTLLNSTDQVRRQRFLAIRAVYKDDPGKKLAPETGRKGLKSIARLKQKGRRRSDKAGRRKHRHRADRGDSIARQEAAVGAKARALGVTSFAELVRLKRKNRQNEDAKAKEGEAADKNAKEEQGNKADTRQAKAAGNAFKLAKERLGGPGTLLARLKALRREGADDDVWSLLRSINPDSADLADPGRWWDFRRSEIRRALSQDHPKTAYAVARAHGPLEGENLSEAEFLAGWIALRFLKDPKRSLPHFVASRAIGFPRSEARAAYWLGRAKLELGAAKKADSYFAEAASRSYTFYGSLARQSLRKKANGCEFRAPQQPSGETVAAFVNEDAFRAVMIAKQLGLEPVLAGYLLDLARQIRDPEQMTLVMEVAERVAPPHIAVRAAKIALLRGYAVEAYAYPVLLPKFDHAGGNTKPEPALLNALTRQESEFYTGTVSRAGARGLMQLLPQTAKQVAATVKTKYEMARLISDPSYNVTLGSAFLAHLVSGYDGSYVLALAAYNAGPGRVAEWIRDFGDPRDKTIDPIDWIERIPFTETRHYVQKILESTQLYRCRFENSKAKFQIVEDLHRGRPGKIPDLNEIAGSAGEDEEP